jgi:GABA(A) receptor-associated protein
MNKEMSPFKRANSIEKRIKEATRILEKFPDRIPVICEPTTRSSHFKMEKTKFLVPKDLRIYQFIMIVRGRLKLDATIALFFIAGDVVASSTATFNQLYYEHADQDGFLYLTFSEENTFGFNI